MPFTRIIPSRASYYTIFEVPQDDESTSTFIVVDSPQAIDHGRIWTILGLDDERYYCKDDCSFRATWSDRFGQDRERMKRNWTGFRGLEQEDAIMSLSMGPVLDRTKEHLVAADQAVVRLRRRVLDNIKLIEDGGDAIGRAAIEGGDVVVQSRRDAWARCECFAVPRGAGVGRRRGWSASSPQCAAASSPAPGRRCRARGTAGRSSAGGSRSLGDGTGAPEARWPARAV